MTTDSQKVALVTGGARGMANNCRQACAGGLKVVATDISPNNDLLSNAHLIHAHDVSSSESWSSVLDVVSKKFGRLDILVNNVESEHCLILKKRTSRLAGNVGCQCQINLAWHQGCHPAHAFQSFWFNS